MRNCIDGEFDFKGQQAHNYWNIVCRKQMWLKTIWQKTFYGFPEAYSYVLIHYKLLETSSNKPEL